MKSLKKIIALMAIFTMVMGGFISTARADTETESLLAPTASNVSAPGASEDVLATTPEVKPAFCTVPTKNYVNDGLGADIDYFNTTDQISGNWDFNDNGCAIEKYNYRVIKKESSLSPWMAVTDWTYINDPGQKQITADASNGLITPLVEGETYRILVRAYNAAGWSVGDLKLADKSDGQILDMTPPTMNYLDLQQDRGYGQMIDLTFSANDANPISNYFIYRNGSVIGEVSGDTNTFHDVITGDNVQFVYYVRAVDVAGNLSGLSNLQSAIVDDIAPGAPSISYWIGGGNIVVFWPQVAGAINYELYRDGVLIKSGPEAKYTDSGLTKGQTYSYTVYALDEAGNKSGPSNTLQIYVPKPTVSSVATAGEVQGTSTGTTETTEQISPSPSPSPSPSGEVQATESSEPEEETEEESKTNWSLIIAIIIAAAIVIVGILYWWYARDNEEDEI